MNTSGGGSVGLGLHFLGSSQGSKITLGRGLEGADFLYAEDTFAAGQPVRYRSPMVMQDMAGNAFFPCKYRRFAAGDSADAALNVQGSNFRDWNILIDQPDAKAFRTVPLFVSVTNPKDSSESMTVAGDYAYARIQSDAIDLFGEVTSFHLRAPGVSVIRLNGHVLPDVTVSGDLLSWNFHRNGARGLREDGKMALLRNGA